MRARLAHEAIAFSNVMAARAHKLLSACTTFRMGCIDQHDMLKPITTTPIHATYECLNDSLLLQQGDQLDLLCEGTCDNDDPCPNAACRERQFRGMFYCSLACKTRIKKPTILADVEKLYAKLSELDSARERILHKIQELAKE